MSGERDDRNRDLTGERAGAFSGESADRVRLESRRWGFVVSARYAEPARNFEMKIYVTVGVDRRTLRVAEVFARPGGQAGKHAMLERTLDDIAPIMSHLLQRGATPDEVAKSLGREGGEAEFRFTLPAAEFAGPHVERAVTMTVSSPVAALAACLIAVQHELDSMPAAARALIREMKAAPVMKPEGGL